jgi:hypothetical protein
MQPTSDTSGAMTYCRDVEVDILERWADRAQEALEQAEHWLSQPDRSIEPVDMLRVLRDVLKDREP